MALHNNPKSQNTKDVLKICLKGPSTEKKFLQVLLEDFREGAVFKLRGREFHNVLSLLRGPTSYIHPTHLPGQWHS